MKTQQELCDILGFIAEYATYQLGSGVHTSRAVRNSRRIGEALGVDVQLSSFQKSTILTVLDLGSGESATRVVAIPSLPISFERNSDLSALSWDALDEGLSLDEIRSRYRTLVDKPRMDPIFTLVFVGLANASFCKLFGGDWTAVGIVFTATLVGFAVKQRMQAHAVNHFLVFACSAFHGRLAFRLHSRDHFGHQSAVSRAGRAAHQRGHRHHGRTRPYGCQPAGQRHAADRLHRRRFVGHFVNG